jgi:hypothetical protein
VMFANDNASVKTAGSCVTELNEVSAEVAEVQPDGPLSMGSVYCTLQF